MLVWGGTVLCLCREGRCYVGVGSDDVILVCKGTMLSWCGEGRCYVGVGMGGMMLTRCGCWCGDGRDDVNLMWMLVWGWEG